jgi:hypothetical protein
MFLSHDTYLAIYSSYGDLAMIPGLESLLSVLTTVTSET